ncbi:hypothetical protein [Stygiolobus sp. CP859M]|uniref:hypothetical protein n=1 Tax=Stygiolobus sp. CP859M TaxID=3133135 RepID=UPI00307D31B4
MGIQRIKVYSGITLTSLGASLLNLPLFVLGLLVMMTSRKAFNPMEKDSIYRPETRRDTAIILFILALLEGITGWGAGLHTSTIINKLTFGLLTREVSFELHVILNVPLSFFFILHSLSGLGSLLFRKGIKNKVVYNLLLPLFMLALFSVAFYLDALYFPGFLTTR